ncbi:MAG: ABC transporter permease [Bacteroidales bacterium]|nr:ABC transporter permease [Bacteroidales bacterium]MCF8338594.1 ABC transporter permease [Bacteroidales bacterium]
MLINYLKIALRNILRNRTYSVINLLGLTVGITASVLILLFVQYHLSFDDHFENKENKYRIVEIQQAQGVGEQHVAFTMAPLAPQIKQDFAEVKQACRVMAWGGGLLKYKENAFETNYFAFADTNVFDMLSLEMIKGNPATTLENTGSMALSRSMAKRIFGTVEEAKGEMVSFRNYGSFNVSGIFEDMPEKAHIKLDVIVDFQTALNQHPWLDGWTSNSMVTYVEFHDNVDVDKFEEKFRDYLVQFAPEDRPRESIYKLYLQPMDDIHLKSNHIKFQYNRKAGNNTFIIVLSAVGIVLLLIGCINYINLSIARSVKRSREVGMRKVLGATRDKLVYQFMGESLIITAFAILLSMGLVELLVPEFNAIMGSTIDFTLSGSFIAKLLAILIIVSLISGFYPAVYLSRYNPATVLKGNNEKGLSSTKLTRILVGFQFFVSTVLILFIIMTNQQVQYIKNKDFGFNYDNIVNLKLYHDENPQKFLSFKAELLQNSNIKGVAYTSSLTGASGSQSTLNVADSSESSVMTRICAVDEDFLPMMEIPIKEGRNFHPNSSLDSNTAVIINQAMADHFGWKNPLGKRFQPYDSDTNRVVIGVVENYHYYDLYSKIEPAAFFITDYRMDHVNIKTSAANHDDAMKFIEEKWNAFFPGKPFKPRQGSGIIMNRYNSVINTLELFTVFVFISLFISALGLFGLSSLYVERKIREIAIRKVLGGTALQINALIVRDFVILIGIAALLSIPVGFEMVRRYLEQFAYHASIEWYYFLLAVVSALVLGSLTVMLKSIRAANTNPVDTLKYE